MNSTCVRNGTAKILLVVEMIPFCNQRPMSMGLTNKSKAVPSAEIHDAVGSLVQRGFIENSHFELLGPIFALLGSLTRWLFTIGMSFECLRGCRQRIMKC